MKPSPQVGETDVSVSQERRARYDATLGRFAHWLRSHLNPDGSLRAPAPSCGAYMPLPVYGYATGQLDVAEGAWRCIDTHYMRDGQLIQPDGRRNMMPYTPAWFVLGATLGERLSQRSTLQRSLLSYQDSRTGGFFGSTASRDAGQGVLDFDSTTQSCAALCAAGQEAAAARCGQFLRTLVQAQPDPSGRFFSQWDSVHGLIREFDPKVAASHVLVYEQPRQYLYKVGLLVRAFASLHGVMGDLGYLELAEGQYRKAVTGSPDIWTNTLAHKMGWAAWTLYRITRQRSYAEDACRVADHLVTLQQPDGGFHYPEFWPPYPDVPLESKVNIGAQFATWIAYARSIADTR